MEKQVNGMTGSESDSDLQSKADRINDLAERLVRTDAEFVRNKDITREHYDLAEQTILANPSIPESEDETNARADRIHTVAEGLTKITPLKKDITREDYDLAKKKSSLSG